MNNQENFRLVMISAGFEHGGNVFHRHMDGHPELLVYPFESQIGCRDYNDFLASVERVQYRYPEFREGMSPIEIYEEFFDEEMKTYLRKRNGSKFHDADLKMDENIRRNAFVKRLGEPPYLRRNAVRSFFQATFDAWENYYTDKRENMVYVGYSPAIGIDSQRMIYDFPNIKILHLVRNPFSAYRDTKRRPFPQPLSKYLITWNIYHSTVEMFSKMYPENVKLLRYEDLVANKEKFMRDVATFVGVSYNETMLYPSWNGKNIEDNIYPWGTLPHSTEEYNMQIISDLSETEINQIVCGTTALAKHFGYDEVPYLRDYYMGI